MECSDELDRFREADAAPAGGVLAEIEQAVIGADYGASGYTTVRQVELIARRLELGPRDLLLDVGSGCGWPAIYLSETTGCRVVVTDIPIEGLHRALRRASSSPAAEVVGVVAGAAERPPFRPGSFDAVCSTDVLC